MNLYDIILFLHILSLVFWLGTDIGVFTLGKFAQNPVYSIDQRLLLLKVALILDMFPRVFMVLTLPTGFHLAATLGVISVASSFIAGVWIFSACWLVVVLVSLLRQESTLGQRAKLVEKVIQFLLLALLFWISISSLITATPILVGWLAWKVFIYGLLLLIIPFLERAFAPAVAGFTALPTQGSSPELESQIKRSMDATFIWVIAIYIVVLLAAFLGVAKPY